MCYKIMYAFIHFHSIINTIDPILAITPCQICNIKSLTNIIIFFLDLQNTPSIIKKYTNSKEESNHMTGKAAGFDHKSTRTVS